MAGPSKQRTDADNAFLRVQNKASVRDRIMSETEIVDRARAEKTARLKAQRLEKEALDRETLAAAPAKREPPKRTKRGQAVSSDL